MCGVWSGCRDYVRVIRRGFVQCGKSILTSSIDGKDIQNTTRYCGMSGAGVELRQWILIGFESGVNGVRYLYVWVVVEG